MLLQPGVYATPLAGEMPALLQVGHTLINTTFGNRKHGHFFVWKNRQYCAKIRLNVGFGVPKGAFH
jgi:ABC-type uncharacterized transport system YnjBCD substrate-binding protein